MSNPIPVTMYWDAANMPSTIADNLLVSRIDTALKTENPRYFLKEIVVCAADTENFATRRTSIETSTCGVTYIRAPMSDLTCDGCETEPADEFTRREGVSVRRLMEKMLSDACHESRVAVPILVVTTNSDFSYAMRDLKNDNYTVFSAVMNGLDGVGAVASASCGYWLWNEMQQGGPRVPLPPGP